jgi:UDP-N-acetylglucosamine 3-dehydrogenase
MDELDKVQFDCAIIATPSSMHYENAERLIRQGQAPARGEAPVHGGPRTPAKLVALANEQGVKMAVGHVERFNPAVRKLREVIAAGFSRDAPSTSRSRASAATPRTSFPGNNVLLDLAVHDIDVVRSLIGPLKVESVRVPLDRQRGACSTRPEVFLASPPGPDGLGARQLGSPRRRSARSASRARAGVCFVDYILQTCELFGGALLQAQQPGSADFSKLLELYRNSDKITFGVNKEEPLRVQLNQFGRFLATGDRGELCVGADAVAAVLLAERSIRLDARRHEEQAVAAPGAVPSLDALFV